MNTMKKKVLFYCQHVLGMGHLIRSREIVHALKEFEVCFLNGGEIVPGFEFAPEIEVVNLPPIKSDAAFKEIQAIDGFQSLAELKKARVRQILAEYARFQPDAVIIELFPFGRRKFAFELIPLLSRIRMEGGKTKVVCSLRDILVSKRDQARHEDQVCYTMNRYFDLLVIHSDPKFQKLKETFSRMSDLKPPARYSGFVANGISEPAATPEPLLKEISDAKVPVILASIGGGRVGIELLECAMAASAEIEATAPHHLLIFTGPYLPEEDYARLEALVAPRPHVTLRRYTTQFLAYMKAAELSISMAGYNTCMNILVTETKSILLPFTGNNNEEQTIRAEKLEALSVATMIRPEDLNPETLAEKMRDALQAAPLGTPLDLDGAKNTARFLKEALADESLKNAAKQERPLPAAPEVLASMLRPALKRHLEAKKTIRIFLRDDDADEDLESLRQLFDVCLASSVPLNLEIIPEALTEAGIRLLDNHKHLHPKLFELNQHGYSHQNHEKEGRKCEFGSSRNFEQQLEDISRGKALLEKTFKDKFYPVYTPPWNRCTEDTLKVLDRLGFKVFSKDKGKTKATGYGFREISTTLDLYRWKGNPRMKAPEEIVEQLLIQMKEEAPIGLLLHHKVMGEAEFRFLDHLLGTLRDFANVQFETFQTLLET